MIEAGGFGRNGAKGADRAATGAGRFEVADGVLFILEMPIIHLNGKVDEIGRSKKREVGKKTHSSAAKLPTARLARHTERIPAARRSSRHAEGSHVGGGSHAALVCSSGQPMPVPYVARAQLTIRVETLAAHVPCTQVICTARENPCVAGCNIVVERRCEGREDGEVGSERVGKEGGRGGVGLEARGHGVESGSIHAFSGSNAETDDGR